MIRELIEKYLKFYPEDVERLEEARNLAKQVKISDSEIFNRKNFTGHFTASTFIINPKLKKILLLEHKSLGILLQPGGHIEAVDDTPIAAALRELKEETGKSASDFTYIALDPKEPLVPFNIDSHYIPENPKKQEDAHLHHDFGYLFVADDIEEVEIDPNESNGFHWINIEDFYKQPHFKTIVPKVKKFLAENRV